ncbi:MAG: DUF1844 domain-containing protein [candidate division WOR-3 bacterium]
MPDNKTPEPNETPEIPASFSTLLLNLSAAALAYLGHTVVPGQEKPAVNLPLAKHTIDTLEMLKVKTQGNLTPEESNLLDDMLYQLRLAYVAAKDQPAPDRPSAPDSSEKETF